MEEKSGAGKRKYGIIAACAVLVLAVVCGAYWMGRSSGGGKDVGEERAKLAALGHAQVSEADLTRYAITRDERNGRAVYEVEFTADGVEYDYEISAADGSVVKFERESVVQAAPVQTPAGNGGSAGDSTGVGMPAGNTSGTPAKPPASSGEAGDIGEARAWEIAYAHAGVSAADAAASKAKVDYDGGVMVYELEFYSGGYEYDYEIKAADGSVVKFEKEADDRGTAAQTSAAQTPSADTVPSYIGEARAKEIACSHAGLTADAVTRCTVELDHHDDHHGGHHGSGCCEYEIDFKCGGYEYEYKVDAVTGEILKSQREVDD